MNVDEDETARAFAAIEETLQGFSSPSVGVLSRNEEKASYYTMDAMEWMTETLKDVDNNEAEPLANKTKPVLKTPKRTPLMERAGTPVMSNSSSHRNLEGLAASSTGTTTTTKKKQVRTPGSGSKYALDDDDDDSEDDSEDDAMDDEDDVPLPVQTPAKFKAKPFRKPSTTPTIATPKPHSSQKSPSSLWGTTYTPATTVASVSLKQNVFRKHHDALWEYLVAKRSISNRMELERQEKELEDQAKSTNTNKLHHSTSHDSLMNIMDDSSDDSNGISEHLAKQECKIEADYCKNLCQIGYGITAVLDSSVPHHEDPMEEGHFWDLLAKLRTLGLPTLIWDDDSTSLTQNASVKAFFLQQLTTKMDATPKELCEALSINTDETSQSSSSQSLPMGMKRRQELLKWIRSCLEKESRDTKSMLPIDSRVPSKSHPDDPSIPSLDSEMDASILKTMAKVCLALFLEGRSNEAREIVRARGQSWKAAAWRGGEPSGYATRVKDDTQTIEHVPVGNPNRFLWKRQAWKSGRKLLLEQQTHLQNNPQQQQQQQLFQPSNPIGLEEAAIYSLLSDDVQNALENPLIRSSWTRSLCALLMGTIGRTQDEVLCRNHNYRRRSGACFPGYQYEQQENEQLMNTSQLSTMTEAQMANMLSTSPFLKQRDDEKKQQRKCSYKKASMAFVVGKSSILDFCATETSRIVSELRDLSERQTNNNTAYATNDDDENADDYANQDWAGIRFLTHLALFLDSLQGSSTPMVCDGITDQKNAILFEYVQYLESRPDLWHMLTLYASLLPESTILDYFPTILARVLDDTERTTMMGQLRELLPTLELPLLRKVVRLSLAAPPPTNRSDDDGDAIRCNSLFWLLQTDEHLEDALVCANILLREFFLDEEEDKTAAAATFLNDHLPEDFLDLVSTVFSSRTEHYESTECSNNDDDKNARVNNAITEHLAYIGYLEAYATFETWKEILQATPTASLDDHKLPSYSNLNETEKAVADSNLLRSWVRQKKKFLETTLSAAEDARLAWHNVLAHPGGWLSVDEDDDETIHTIGGDDDTEEKQRLASIRKIRSRHLVLAANLYHQVCEETAAWLALSLREAEDFALSKTEVLQQLRLQETNHSTPDYWYRHALDLAVLVASDEHGIHKAFPDANLQEFITKLGETAVSKLMNV